MMNRYADLVGVEAAEPHVAPGWTLSRVQPASGLFGANGMQFGPDGRLYVAQAFGSQITAIDIESGALEAISPQGGPIIGPDDIAFDSQGTMYVTEVMSARVSARSPAGDVRVLADDLPSANGITVYQDRVFIDEHRRGGRVFELYPDGSRAPRLITDELFGPNALMAGPDGKLYFPLVPLGEVWRVDIETGAKDKVAEGLAAPPAVKFNPKGELVVPQSRTGEIVRIDVQSGAKTVIARVRPGIDNIVFASDGRLFVSHFIDGGVAEVATDGSSRERVLVPPGFVGPWGVVCDTAGTLHLGDGLSLAKLDTVGAVRRLGGILDERFPGFIRGIALGNPGELLMTTGRGDVVRYNLGDRSFTTPVKRLQPLYGIAPMADGAVLVAGVDTGTLLRVDDAGQTTPIVTGLAQPSDVVPAGDGRFFVSEMGNGRVVAVDLHGSVSPVLHGLTRPKGMALYQGSLLVLDHGAKELCAVDLRTQQHQVVASQLPVGAAGPMDFPGGLAVSSDGTIYIAGDAEGSIVAIRQA